MHYTVAKIMDILADESKITSLPIGYARVTLEDGKRVEMHTGDMLIHGILWKNLQHFNVKVDKNQVYKTYPVTGGMISQCLTKQYARLLEACPNVPHMELVYRLWESIHDIYKFVYIHLGEWQRTADLIDLIDVATAPEVRDLTLKPLPTDQGTKIAEAEFNMRSKKLNQILSTPGAMKYNPIIDFMQTGAFKGNQIPQLLMALGTRDDINGRMLPHIMNCSGLTGMRSLSDLGTEAASPKKTTYYNTSIIKDTQSFYREMRLLTCNLNVAHKGDCGRRFLINHLIEEGRGHNYVDKVVKHNGKMVAITWDNCHEFEGHKVGLVSPIACKYVDGVCEHCAGRATTDPWAYMPDVRIGVYAASLIFSDISQKVLSAKHLIKTFTINLMMSKKSHNYLLQDAKHNLRLNRQTLKNLDEWSILVETEKVGHPNDLKVEGISPVGFGKFNRIGFRNKRTGVLETFPIATNDMIQHFSQDMLDYMRDVRDKIEIVDTFYEIPLKDYNSRKAIIMVEAKNDDMVAFAHRVQTIFRKGVSEYPNIELALSNIANEIHSKVNANIFFIELIIKAILNSVLADDGKIDVQNMRDAIASNNVAAKLGHSYVKDYLHSPDVTVATKQPSPFDYLFGFIEEM